MDLELVKKVNLAEHLSEFHPLIGELSEEDIAAWSEDQIRAHYTDTHAAITGSSTSSGNTLLCYGRVSVWIIHAHCSTYKPLPMTPGCHTSPSLQVRQGLTNLEEACLSTLMTRPTQRLQLLSEAISWQPLSRGTEKRPSKMAFPSGAF